MSFFSSIELKPEDPILNLAVLFAADKREKKVNLGIGSYKDENGKSFVLKSVHEAEKILLEKKLDKEYPPIEGHAGFISAMAKLVFGSLYEKELKERTFGAHTVGCTSALRSAAELFSRNISTKIYFPHPTWPNHKTVFTLGGLQSEVYPYYDVNNKSLDFVKMCEALKKLSSGTIVVLHSNCHNPTGIDPSNEQWKELSALFKLQKLIPLFDIAYQGFGETPEEDVFSVRYFAEQGHEMIVTVSCSKNFGLYGERIGALYIVTKDKEIALRVGSQIKLIVRGGYSVPPLHGARIVSTILESEKLTEMWRGELSMMRDRLREMRSTLAKKLKEYSVEDVDFFIAQRGLFSLTGLNMTQVLSLRQDKAIYMENHGRINIAGLNHHNIDYFVESIAPYMEQNRS